MCLSINGLKNNIGKICSKVERMYVAQGSVFLIGKQKFFTHRYAETRTREHYHLYLVDDELGLAVKLGEITSSPDMSYKTFFEPTAWREVTSRNGDDSSFGMRCVVLEEEWTDYPHLLEVDEPAGVTVYRYTRRQATDLDGVKHACYDFVWVQNLL